MTKRTRAGRFATAGLSLCAGLAGALVLAAPAQAAQPGNGARQPGSSVQEAQQELRTRGPNEHCVVVLERTHPDKPDTRVKSAECDTNPKARSMRAEAAASTLIMTWYTEPDYRGTSTDIRVDGGDCDIEGYGISDVRGYGWKWNDDISSFRTYNGCNTTQAYEIANYGGVGIDYLNQGNVPWVGGAVDNKISSIHTFHVDY